MKLGTPDLRRHEFGDPAKAYERDEDGTCAGCVHEDLVQFRMTKPPGHLWMKICTKGKTYGRRCKLYRVREAVTRTDGDG